MTSTSTESIVFDRAAHFYDQTRGFPPGVESGVSALLQKAGNLTQNSRVLEIGVGTGRIAIPLLDYVKSLLGIDLSRPMMEKLREKPSSERISLIEGDITRLPLAAQSVDVVVAVHILHLVPDWRTALSEAARVLHPNGVLLSARNTGTHTLDVLWNALDNALPADKRRDPKAEQNERTNYLVEAGWHQQGEPYVYTYIHKRRPNEILDHIQNRTWSRMWTLTDEELAACMNAVKWALKANFNHPDEELPLQDNFEVQVFTPPQ